ncbi:TPA: response regulator transcription factor [Candidatus Poribacteria bacterium]|nr:response regulator transcription factor [Candidatus Poribacteria bacterium]
MKYRILLVDDDKDIVEFLTDYLEDEGYEVIPAYDGREAIIKAQAEEPHLIVLDIMLPFVDGFEVCRRIRQYMAVPILMLTAKSEDVDRIIGLEIGADDYVVKPFNPRELLARIKAILRRVYREEYQVRPIHEKISIGNLRIDPERREVTVGGRKLDLKPKEFDLLHFLALNRGRVYTRNQLIDRVWGRNYLVGPRTVDVHISRLREQIEEAGGDPDLIQTVWGIGYKLSDE